MTLGSTIRDAREAARLSIESLSESTSIRIGLLTEMENNNFANLFGPLTPIINVVLVTVKQLFTPTGK